MDKALGRYPDFVVGEEDDPYLLRWFVIPRNRFFNIYLHKFCRSDDDRALHDHPWAFNCSILLKGSYVEHVFFDNNHQELGTKKLFRNRGSLYFRAGAAPHRVELFPDVVSHKAAPCWTLFITGATVREWGFHCPNGWKPWKEFVSVRDGGNSTGAGCD